MIAIDEDKALLALDGNRELLIELANMFVQDAPQVLSQLRQALLVANVRETLYAVHSLRGLAATFYAQPTVALTKTLEDSAAIGHLETFDEVELGKLEQSVESIVAAFVQRGWIANN